MTLDLITAFEENPDLAARNPQLAGQLGDKVMAAVR